ncbi:MAG: hypothetical protein U1F33_05170 [Alphaproteobacteria bacterium]
MTQFARADCRLSSTGRPIDRAPLKTAMSAHARVAVDFGLRPMNVTMRRTVAGALMALALLGAGIGVHWLLRVRSGPPPDVLPEPVAHTSIAPVWRPLNELDPSNEGYLAEVLSYMRQQLEGDVVFIVDRPPITIDAPIVHRCETHKIERRKSKRVD